MKKFVGVFVFLCMLVILNSGWAQMRYAPYGRGFRTPYMVRPPMMPYRPMFNQRYMASPVQNFNSFSPRFYNFNSPRYFGSSGFYRGYGGRGMGTYLLGQFIGGFALGIPAALAISSANQENYGYSDYYQPQPYMIPQIYVAPQPPVVVQPSNTYIYNNYAPPAKYIAPGQPRTCTCIWNAGAWVCCGN